ncbi:MAG TPA: SpoIIE family protein phosphatase [Oscillospiraceae bacterium]|nr:SpoIIE family protein phosphatase [Oscillospiraceae bacterium]
MSERTLAVEPYVRTSRAEGKISKKKFTWLKLAMPHELLCWETVGAVSALVLLTQLQLMGELAPFALPFWAVASRNETRRMYLYGAVMLIAALLTEGVFYSVELLLGIVVYSLLWVRARKVSLPYVMVISIALLIGAIPRIWLAHFQPYEIFLLSLEIVLATLATVVFIQVFNRSPAYLCPERHIEGITAWIVFIGLLLLAMVQAAEVLAVVASGLAKFVVLWASFWLGPGLAAAAGALLGFMLGIQGTSFAWVGVLTFAGFVAGLFRPYGRLATLLAFSLGTGALALYVFGWESVVAEMLITLLASCIFLLTNIAPAKVKILAPFLRRGTTDEAQKMRELTAVRVHDYGLVFRELADAFVQAAAVEEESRPALARLVEGVAARVCHNCASRRRCWEKDVQRTYNAMLRVLADLDAGKSIIAMRTPEFFEKFCCKKDDFLRTVAFLHELEASGQAWQQKLQDSREVVTTQLMGLSQIMINLARDVREGLPEQQRIKNQYFHLELGIAQAAKGDQEVCGDYYSYLELRDGKQAFILSDGMGNGKSAHQESQAAVKLVEQLLLAGFRKDAVIRTVNTILQLRSPDEIFATLDVLIVDTEKGEAEFLKTGAAPSYLHTNKRVQEVKSASLPLGILSEVELKPVNLTLTEDSLIVMITDGVFEAAPGQPDWLKKYLVNQTYTHPQVLADDILVKARQLNGRAELRDDLTVLVCRAKRLKHKIRDYMTA